ncbi:hypothetical protein [Roseomonas elaeocarpi]|uniref:Uncharacterized protein n=1 Tax=Roseomonas elaeocarpi TaxID=907779 RepID=A0ABV6JVK7_9PROT
MNAPTLIPAAPSRRSHPHVQRRSDRELRELCRRHFALAQRIRRMWDQVRETVPVLGMDPDDLENYGIRVRFVEPTTAAERRAKDRVLKLGESISDRRDELELLAAEITRMTPCTPAGFRAKTWAGLHTLRLCRHEEDSADQPLLDSLLQDLLFGGGLP